MTKVSQLTKGKVLINGTTGAQYTILTKKPQTTGTGTPNQPNYLVMVRPTTGRAFDLILSQESLDQGAYRLQ